MFCVCVLCLLRLGCRILRLWSSGLRFAKISEVAPVDGLLEAILAEVQALRNEVAALRDEVRAARGL